MYFCKSLVRKLYKWVEIEAKSTNLSHLNRTCILIRWRLQNTCFHLWKWSRLNKLSNNASWPKFKHREGSYLDCKVEAQGAREHTVADHKIFIALKDVSIRERNKSLDATKKLLSSQHSRCGLRRLSYIVLAIFRYILESTIKKSIIRFN